ncbi:AKT-interacting protein [Varanus komodoensis]|nr:AKT-interacting protein [Varanus komodoensis]
MDGVTFALPVLKLNVSWAVPKFLGRLQNCQGNSVKQEVSQFGKYQSLSHVAVEISPGAENGCGTSALVSVGLLHTMRLRCGDPAGAISTLVVKQKLPGVYIQPSYQSALMWFGVIFIRHGLYQDGVFKFTVYIPDNYPDGDCPVDLQRRGPARLRHLMAMGREALGETPLARLVFDLPIFHPLVDPGSGELDVKRAFAKWRRNHNHIWQILMYARRVFYKIDTTSPLNPEAAVLYEKDIQLFKSKVVDSVKLCSSHLFDPPKIEDPYAISFSPWNPAIHDEAREKMLTQKAIEGGIREHISFDAWFLRLLLAQKLGLTCPTSPGPQGCNIDAQGHKPAKRAGDFVPLGMQGIPMQRTPEKYATENYIFLEPAKKAEEQQSKSMQVSGLSWVKPGSVQPFSKEEKTLPT